ncbi:MAG TPA: LytTR family DNA-binding domain-containing protein [Longimicrobiales bacterium]|nr:LytTR family DNA-binding domain-containing protein [Longimicrobiales bacterium]
MKQSDGQPIRIRAIIADDEPIARDTLRIALLRNCADVEIVAECEDARSTIDAVNAGGANLIFLDIGMPGMDGFGVIDAVGAERMPFIIFVTGYDSHAVRAFEVHAFDYVLKPFDDDRIASTVERARAFLRLQRDSDTGQRLARVFADIRDNIDTGLLADDSSARREPLPPDPGSHLTRLTVKGKNGLRFVFTADVKWFESAGNYVAINTADSRFLLRASIRELIERLDPREFVRIHRSTVVNVRFVREVQPWAAGDYVVLLEGGGQLRASRTYARQLLSPFDSDR